MCEILLQTFEKVCEFLKKSYKEECMSHTQCYEWFKRFKEGRTSVSKDPRPGRPSTSTDDCHVERFRGLICGNCRLTVRGVPEEVAIIAMQF